MGAARSIPARRARPAGRNKAPRHAAERLDCLLVHVPKPRHLYRPIGHARFINFLPIGLVSLANHARRAGFTCRIAHLGLPDEAGRPADLARLVAEHRPRVIGLSLHWHHQSAAVVEAATVARRALPDAYILLGGYTASFFAEEILGAIDAVDAVIRGEGEAPLVALLSALAAGGRGLDRVPGLVRRVGGRVVAAAKPWVASAAELTGFSFADLGALIGAARYPDSHMYLPEDPRLREALLARGTVRLHILSIGRGCRQDCAYCGGGRAATALVSGRRCVALRDPAAVAAEAVESRAAGYSGLFCDYDDPRDPGYMIRLIETVGRAAGRPHWRMNLWAVPPDELVAAFAAHTAPGSTIYLSPVSGGEALRARFGGVFYENAAVERMVRTAKARGVPVFLFFAYGMPGEDDESRADTRRLAARVTRLHPGARCLGYPVELDPASPMFLSPESFGITARWRTFGDYRRHHATGEFHIGYDLPGQTEEEILARRCRELCILDHRWGPAACAGLRLARVMPGGTAAVALCVRALRPWHARLLRTGHS